MLNIYVTKIPFAITTTIPSTNITTAVMSLLPCRLNGAYDTSLCGYRFIGAFVFVCVCEWCLTGWHFTNSVREHPENGTQTHNTQHFITLTRHKLRELHTNRYIRSGTEALHICPLLVCQNVSFIRVGDTYISVQSVKKTFNRIENVLLHECRSRRMVNSRGKKDRHYINLHSY